MANPRIDLSKTEKNNATKALVAAYDILKAETCPHRLAKDIREVVVGAGLAGPNLEKLDRAIADSFERRSPIEALQFYLANFILAGSKLSVNAGKHGKLSMA